MIFWDLDGPILEVSAKYYAVYRDIILENKSEPLLKKEFWEFKRSKMPLNEILSKTNSEKLINKFKKLWVARIETSKYQKLDKLQPEIIEVLKLCKEKNNLVMVTLRRNRQRLLKQLDELNLIDFFEDILSSGDNIKPRWKIKYNLINEYLKGETRENHIIIGDTETDILAGHNLGFISIGVLCGIRNNRLIDSKPNKVVNQSSELVEFIL